ncbi:hypothetical protein [Hyalangium minutum]|uniref:DUF3352 domain-containing protein n=1 Tax=Hyalangium minutum TaxID=394096 RepID=A0A085WJS5_9BACT|nr:hypothetical protein [Hyalangium minutum]KFE67938.1 hypothetical protein DB31_7175 [Hyalangium minutum]
MSSSETPSGPSPEPPRSGGGASKAILVAIVTVVVSGVGVGAYVLGRRSANSGAGSDSSDTTEQGTSGVQSAGATVEGMPPPPPTQRLSPPTQGSPAVWVDVYQPAKVRSALVGNAWLQQQMKKPLGQGFASSWAAFFGSTGEDLKASFKGAVFDVVAGQLLDSPFRALWFVGGSDSNAPAFIVPAPNATAATAYEAMEKVASRGGYTSDKCPYGAPASATVPEGGFKIARWLVAEQSLYAARTADRIVVARQPNMVLRGLCAELTKLEAPANVDLELGFNSEVLGRETVFLTHALGLANGTRLQFGAEGKRLVPRGITGPLLDKVRLDAAPLSDDLLKLVPSDTPVLLALQLKLPESLEGAKIKQYWEGQDPGQVRTRQIALVWTPRGDADLGHEFAILWGRVEDAPALKTMFAGGNTLEQATLCKHQVLASEPQVLQRLQSACEGKSPNLLNAAGPVVEGLRAPGSVTIGLNTGHLLSQLLADGYWSEQQLGKNAPVPGSAPAEIEEARKDLETLPYVGLRGTVEGNSLVPGGFGS